MYSCAKQFQTGIEIEFADFVTLKNHSKSQDFAAAIEAYYRKNVQPDLDAQKKTKKA